MQWRKVIALIEQGAFSWADLAQGKMVRHPVVAAALNASGASRDDGPVHADDDDYFDNWSISA